MAEHTKPAHITLTWDTYGELLHGLSEQLKPIQSEKAWDFVCGIPRGGLTVAVYLSHQLGIKYSDLKDLPSSGGCKVLLVDDISDTGDTLAKLKAKLEAGNHEVYTATLYINSSTEFLPDTYVEKTDIWVRFPYEKYENEDALFDVSCLRR